MTQKEFFESYKQLGNIDQIEELGSDEFDRWDLCELPKYVLMDGCLFERKQG
jgi:hypothetical protein